MDVLDARLCLLLHSLPNLGDIPLSRLFLQYGSAQKIWDSDPGQWASLGVSAEAVCAARVVQSQHLSSAGPPGVERQLDSLVQLGAREISLTDACYPALFAGQTNERIYEELDLRTVTPGARAVGMGKTFVGLADDATAAYSNPAGLSNLLEHELSFEFQLTNIKHHRFIPSENDEIGEFGETVLTPSFFSYARPIGRSTISIFFNRIQDYREDFQFDGRFIDSIGTVEDGSFGNISVQANNYGIGYSYVFNRFLSLGGSAIISTIDVESEGRSGTPDNPRNGTNTDDFDTSLSGIAGLLIKPTRNLSLGAVYYAGSSFALETTLFGSFLERGTPDVDRTGETKDIGYVIPRRYAIGGAWRILNNLTILADLVHVKYSEQLTDKFLIVDFMDSSAELTQENFSIRDVWETHVGAEYRHYRPGLTIAARAGFFTDPDHKLRFIPVDNDHIAQKLLNFRFNTIAPKTDVGITFGGGVAFSNKFQLDMAVSLSRDNDEFAVSMVMKL